MVLRPCRPKTGYGLGMMMMMMMMMNLIYSEYFHQLLKGDHPLLCLVPLLGNLVQIGKQMYTPSSFLQIIKGDIVYCHSLNVKRKQQGNLPDAVLPLI